MRDYGNDIRAALLLSQAGVKGQSENYKRFAGKYELPSGVRARLKLVPLKHKWIFAGVSLSCGVILTILINLLF